MRDRDREDKCNADFILHDAVFLKKRAYVSLSLSLSLAGACPTTPRLGYAVDNAGEWPSVGQNLFLTNRQ